MEEEERVWPLPLPPRRGKEEGAFGRARSRGDGASTSPSSSSTTDNSDRSDAGGELRASAPSRTPQHLVRPGPPGGGHRRVARPAVDDDDKDGGVVFFFFRSRPRPRSRRRFPRSLAPFSPWLPSSRALLTALAMLSSSLSAGMMTASVPTPSNASPSSLSFRRWSLQNIVSLVKRKLES